MANSETGEKRQPGVLLRKADQLTVAVLVAAAGVAMLAWWGYHSRLQGRLIEIEQAAPLDFQFTLDVNQANWPEFAQLPDVGEVLARRIVDERTRGGPFRGQQDLQDRVSGIGPRTLDKMSPYLRPIAGDEEIVGAGAPLPPTN